MQPLQNVNTKAQRVKVLKWMEATIVQRRDDVHIVSVVVKQFLDVFRAQTLLPTWSKVLVGENDRHKCFRALRPTTSL